MEAFTTHWSDEKAGSRQYAEPRRPAAWKISRRGGKAESGSVEVGMNGHADRTNRRPCCAQNWRAEGCVDRLTSAGREEGGTGVAGGGPKRCGYAGRRCSDGGEEAFGHAEAADQMQPALDDSTPADHEQKAASHTRSRSRDSKRAPLYVEKWQRVAKVLAADRDPERVCTGGRGPEPSTA